MNSNLLPGPPRNGAPYPSELAPRQYFEAPRDYPPQQSQDEEHDGLLTYWRILRRHLWILLLTGTLGMIIRVLMTLPQTPVYQATAAVEIEGINEDFLNMKAMSPTASSSPYYDIQTQVREMQSRPLMERVFKKMSTFDRAALSMDSDGLSAWRKALHLGDAKPPSIEDAVASANVSIKSEYNTRIVEISCDSTNPKVAAQFANSVAEEYIQLNQESRLDASQRTSQWLGRQLQDLKVKLEKSEDDLQSYMASAGLMFVGSGSGEKGASQENVAEDRLRQLQTEALKAEADLAEKQSRFQSVQSAAPESLGEVLDDKSVADYQAKLTDLHRQMAELNVSLTPDHPKVKKLQASIDALESGMKRARQETLKRIDSDFQTARTREKLLSDSYTSQKQVVTDQAAKVVHYNILKREADTNRQIYEAILQKVKESGIVSAMQASAIRIIDPAVAPGAPYKPNLTRNALIGLLGGLFFGIIIVFVREQSNRNLQQPGDTPFYLNLPELGVIPTSSVDNSRALRAPKLGIQDADVALRREQEIVELVTANRKFSMMAEAFRTTLTSLLFSGRNGDQPRVIVLTSANPAEGKTTVTINLAIALAEINRKVLLIDADMRRPRLQSLFDLGAGPGLADLLREKAPFDETNTSQTICPTSVPSLFVMRSGRNSGIVSNLLHSARLPELLLRLRNEFDAVVIDTPPVLQISDARVIGRLADAVILVVRAGKTTRDAALMVKQRFGEDGTPVLGTIFNDWNPKDNLYGYKYRNYNGNGAQYSRKEVDSDQEKG